MGESKSEEEPQSIFGTLEGSPLPGYVTYRDEEDIYTFSAMDISLINTNLIGDSDTTELTLCFTDPEETLILGVTQIHDEVIGILKTALESDF